VFSSFKIYGWADADKQFEPLYERIRNHPQMTYHGFAPNEEVKAHLLNAHIHAYPSIWLECNSRSVIEAMSAGLMCVHPNFGGLVDTSGGLNFMYQGDQDINKHANIFYQALDHAIQNVSSDGVQDYLKLVKVYADSRYSWSKVASQWEDLLTGLKQQYGDVNSRKVPSAKFVYNT
jgi:glycosyltransferase involved in cell wall biosynthesis